MTQYILLAVGAVFLTVVAGMLVPEGKLNKAITFVLRSACIFILITPLFGVFDINLDDGEDVIIDYGYVCEVYSENQSRLLEDMIAENTGAKCVCTVEIIYEDGAFKENGVNIVTDTVEDGLIGDIVSYLRELGYININVNEKTY